MITLVPHSHYSCVGIHLRYKVLGLVGAILIFAGERAQRSDCNVFFH